MKTIYKDILRYIILLLVSVFMAYVIVEALSFAYEAKKLSGTIAGLIGSIIVPTVGAWVFMLKWFFQTKAE